MPAFKTNTKHAALLAILICLWSSTQAQKGKSNLLSPEKKLPTETVTLQVAPQFTQLFPETRTLTVPKGYRASLYYTGRLSKGRFMTWGPDSTLYIANMNSGQVLALPDRNHDLVADTVIVAARDVYGHDVKFLEGTMYVPCETRVEKLDDKDRDGVFESRSTFIDSILKGNKRPPGGHTTRTLVFDPGKKTIYLSVGSSCNICREENRAVIFAFDLDGKNRQLFATGTRNCVGMTLNPKTGALWATNNGSDYLGNDTPPEWISVVKKGGFYGYPFAFGDQQYFDFSKHKDYRKILPVTSQDSALVERMEGVSGNIKAHSSPMAIEFANASFGRTFSGGAFVACRGSFEVSTRRGYNVLFLDISGSRINSVSEVISGFLPEEGKPWARPVGLLADARGNLYVSSDDLSQFILVLSPLDRAR